MKKENSIQNRKVSNMAAFLQYTVLFCILVAGIFGVLIIKHKSFLLFPDGIKQMYFWTAEFRHQIQMLFNGEGLQLWSWSKVLGMSIMTNRYWDPFNWIAAAFPPGYIELGCTVSVILRFYFGGLSFLALTRYTGLSVFASVFGAAAYAFCGFNIVTGLQHSDMLVSIYLFPLLVITVEMMYKGRSPVFFSLATGLYLVTNLYYSYMGAVSIILYILLRYFAYRKFDLKDYAVNTGRFAFFGIVGIFVGSIQFLPDFAALSLASTESIADKGGLLFDKDFYLRFGERLLVGTGNTKNYTIMGWTLLIIILLVIAVAGLRLSKTPALMSLILFIGTMLPAVCSIYNGFSYPNRRWIFALELFAAWAAAEELDGSRLFKKSGPALAAAALSLTAFLTLGMNYMFDLGLSRRALIFLAIQLAGGAAFTALLVMIRKEGQLKRLSKAMILVIFTVTMSAAWSVSFADSQSLFYRNNSINKKLSKSVQRAGALIEDDSFYRVDQADSMLYIQRRAKVAPNETLWWQTRSVYGYNSRLPSDLLEFNRLVCNNYGYSKRIAVNSNDNRTGLDYLCAVKYFLGDDLKNGVSGSDEYAGYGFEQFATLDGVNVLKSKYDVSLGYVFDKYMSVSELEKLGYAEREQAMLQAVVLPDGVEAPSARRLGAGDIRTAVKDVSYTYTAGDGIKLKEDTIVVKKAGSSITLEPEDVENSQLMVSMTGLLRNATDGQSKSFEVHVTNEYTDAVAKNSSTSQTIPNIRDYTLNLGYYDHYSGGKIKITFEDAGKYSCDGIKLLAMDADLFDDCIGELSGSRYKIDSFSDTSVEGSIDSENGGILFLSILEPERWECFIDGNKAEVIKNTDMAFTGVEVPAGHHDVTLRFNNRMAKKGRLLSVFGLAVLAVTEVIRRRRSSNC